MTWKNWKNWKVLEIIGKFGGVTMTEELGGFAGACMRGVYTVKPKTAKGRRIARRKHARRPKK